MSNLVNNMGLKIVEILMKIADAQIDTNISFWVCPNRLIFELEHRFGGDLRLRAKIVDDMNPRDGILWSNAIYCGVWTDKLWTLCPSDITRLVEQAVAAAEGEL